jgi:hypothetical protein
MSRSFAKSASVKLSLRGLKHSSTSRPLVSEPAEYFVESKRLFISYRAYSNDVKIGNFSPNASFPTLV